jgi:hypothetical protein
MQANTREFARVEQGPGWQAATDPYKRCCRPVDKSLAMGLGPQQTGDEHLKVPVTGSIHYAHLSARNSFEPLSDCWRTSTAQLFD